MKRCLLATGALLLAAVVVARADYVIIKINLAAAKERDTQAAQPQQQFPGGGLLPGGRGGLQGGLGGKLGRQGGLQGGQGLGGQGGRGVPPAGSGMRGGLGFQGGGAPNMMMQQQRMQQGMRAQMGMGGNAMMGMMGMQTGPEEESDPVHVGAVIEVERGDIDKKGTSYGRHIKIRHKWGATHLAYPAPDIQYTIYNKLDTVAKRFTGRKAEIKEDDPDRPRKVLELAQWALEHDLIGSAVPTPNQEARPPSPVDHVGELMAELAKIDSNNPIVMAFQTVQKQIERKPSQDDPALSWRDKLDFKEKSSEHYTLLYDGDRKPIDVDHCLARLEHNYKGFYYWFALHGKVLNVPGHRLIVFLWHDKNEFDSKRTAVFDNPVMVEDGFFAPRDDVAVLSSTRSDEAFQALEAMLKPYWESVAPQDVLLRGKAKAKLGTDYDTVARAETMELVHQAMKEEALLAAVTYEGTRQLIRAAGLLPRGVESPQWIDFGLGSFLETPRGAYWPTIGGPNMHYLARLHYWADSKNKNLEPNALEALQAVVTDRYFEEVKEGKTKESQLNRARIMAWALTFFLAQKHPDGLIRYYQELSNMPHDLKLDREVMLSAFARAFGLAEAGNPAALDKTKADQFARKWYNYVKNAIIEVDTLYRDYQESQKKAAKTGSATGDKTPYPGGELP